jgi:transketolase
MQAGVSVPLRIVGIPDEDTVTGSQADIFRHYGITMEGLAHAALELLNRPKSALAARSPFISAASL